jgi:DNA-binding NarL/FixJ family response regulator
MYVSARAARELRFDDIDVVLVVMLARGHTYGEIGKAMRPRQLSEDAVKSRVTRMNGKVGARNQVSLIAQCYEHGILHRGVPYSAKAVEEVA